MSSCSDLPNENVDSSGKDWLAPSGQTSETCCLMLHKLPMFDYIFLILAGCDA